MLDLPEPNELDDFDFDPGVRETVQTANLRQAETDNHFPLNCLTAARDIAPGEQVGLSYGPKYWEDMAHFGIRRCLFDKNGAPIDPKLYRPNYIQITFTKDDATLFCKLPRMAVSQILKANTGIQIGNRNNPDQHHKMTAEYIRNYISDRYSPEERKNIWGYDICQPPNNAGVDFSSPSEAGLYQRRNRDTPTMQDNSQVDSDDQSTAKEYGGNSSNFCPCPSSCTVM